MQRELLEAFFERDQRFVLTGGGALAGFYLGHRVSKDLDLFARPPAELDSAERSLADAAAACGATVRPEARHPEFRRLLVQRGDDSTLVDLVVDRAPELDADKSQFGVVRVDTLREISANKICTLLSRCEIRDLVDIQSILAAGGDLERALEDAEKKDAGVNAATLAWLLSELSIPRDAPLPGDVDADELQRFQRELVSRLRKLAFPSGAPEG